MMNTQVRTITKADYHTEVRDLAKGEHLQSIACIEKIMEHAQKLKTNGPNTQLAEVRLQMLQEMLQIHQGLMS
ncbi:hypothetical protein [Marinoscillum luteum]